MIFDFLGWNPLKSLIFMNLLFFMNIFQTRQKYREKKSMLPPHQNRILGPFTKGPPCIIEKMVKNRPRAK